MGEGEQLIERFYGAFQQRDATGMVACYHPEVRFSDPVFGGLEGPRAGAMWEMLCARGQDLRIEFGDVWADETTGRAHWDAFYSISGTGRKVHNSIDASFSFRDGAIISHTDSFDLHRWAAQALGLTGKLLGGTGLMQRKIRATALRSLEAFERARTTPPA